MKITLNSGKSDNKMTVSMMRKLN